MDKESRRFWRAAEQRLGAAEFLLKAQGFRLEAIYLAGYAVECALKALIIERVPKRQRQEVIQGFRGQVWHSFEYLKRKLTEFGCPLPVKMIETLRILSSWSTDLRYESGLRDYNDTKRFIEGAIEVRDWVKGSLL